MEFWRLLALCHTVMPERGPNGSLVYEAQSPDEAALTSAARNFGFVFKTRTARTITLEVDGVEEVQFFSFNLILIFSTKFLILPRSSAKNFYFYCTF